MATPHNSPEAKEQMLKECRKVYRGNRHELIEIKKFEETYRAHDAIRWYTKPCFLFRLINNALRSEDPFALYTYRFFIFDLSAKLAIERRTSIEPFSLYRGAKFHQEEIEQLSIDSLVAVNGFFSSSRKRHVAETFIDLCPITGKSPSRSRNDNVQYVLFEILIDWSVSPDCIVADAHTQSYVEDEEEMIFDLGTTFVITSINYDSEHFLWNINMTASSEAVQYVKEYHAYISERLKEFDANVLFGRILITNLAEYSHALTFYHTLLRTIPADSEERPNIYFELARTYRFLGEHKKAIACFRAVLLLQRRYLPHWKYAYGVTLAGLGTVYLEMEDSKKALDVLEKASICFSDYPLDYNYETIFHANRLSYAYYLEKQYERAHNLLITALDAYKRKMPSDHPSHAQAWHNMGLVQRALGKRDESLIAFKEALRMRKSRLSADHPYIARTHYQMSLLYEELGEMKLALEHAKAALSVRKIRLPPKHDEFKESVQLVDRLLSNQT
jgi:tetratricopeptide (TPR) repeat protein